MPRVQFGLLELEDSQGNDRLEETSHWLRDLASALVSRGEDVEWWPVTDERSRFAATLMQDHLLPRLRSHGEVVVVGHGVAVASWMVALDHLLRAAGAREQVVLVWVAPASSTLGPAASALDWEGLKRACSIVAPAPRIRQELTARRVGSMVIERGEEAARMLANEHARRPSVSARGSGAASGTTGHPLACS